MLSYNSDECLFYAIFVKIIYMPKRRLSELLFEFLKLKIVIVILFILELMFILNEQSEKMNIFLVRVYFVQYICSVHYK